MTNKSRPAEIDTPYVRQSRRNNQTWTLVEVLDLTHPDAEFAPNGGRWAVTCVDHAAIMSCATLGQAVRQASDPAGWCADCLDRLNHRLRRLGLPERSA